MGSLFLLQEIFPTQKSNQGLLLCRHVLYQLSYQGSPRISDAVILKLRISLLSSSVTYLSSTSADVSLTSAREFSLISKAFVIRLDLFK